ncbi:MAG: DUF362 domain-containing protein, partial [Thermodesulfobacteriota bacterium]
IDELSVGDMTEAEYRTFKIEQADPVSVAQTLEELFNPKPVKVNVPASARGRIELPAAPQPVLSVVERSARMPRVGIRRTIVDRLDQDVEKILDLIGYTPVKERVLLKPNIVAAASPENGDDTHPRVTEALIRYFQKRGKEVVLGEGSGIFDSDEAFERLLGATGYLDLRDRLGVPIINLEQVEREDVPWKYGSIPLPKLLAE